LLKIPSVLFNKASLTSRLQKFAKDWVYAYEAYFTNGFDEQIINNSENRTSLPATKLNKDRFEESFNGSPLFTGKAALRNKKIGELGLSYMGGVYNKFQDDGVELDKKRRVNVYAVDFNTTFKSIGTFINTEWAWVNVNLPANYTEQFGRKQQGGFSMLTSIRRFVSDLYPLDVLPKCL
jgi:hypothetical protein